MAGLGTDGPPSRLHAGPAGPSKHKAAVVGGHRPGEVPKAERTSGLLKDRKDIRRPRNTRGRRSGLPEADLAANECRNLRNADVDFSYAS